MVSHEQTIKSVECKPTPSSCLSSPAGASSAPDCELTFLLLRGDILLVSNSIMLPSSSNAKSGCSKRASSSRSALASLPNSPLFFPEVTLSALWPSTSPNPMRSSISRSSWMMPTWEWTDWLVAGDVFQLLDRCVEPSTVVTSNKAKLRSKPGRPVSGRKVGSYGRMRLVGLG